MTQDPVARRSPRAYVLAGVVVILVVFVGFGGWAALAPLSSAALAPGRVAVEGDAKTIQHLEGGIVGEILVSDGDVVRAGQVLIRLDDTQVRSQREAVFAQLLALEAIGARLQAERDGAEAVVFPPLLTGAALRNDEARKQMATQDRLFASRRAQLDNSVDILGRQIEQKREEINGLEAQLAGETRKRAIISEELGVLRDGAQRGVVRKRDLLAKEREAADIQGAIGRVTAEIARARQAIAESEIKIVDQRNERVNRAVEELQRVQASITKLREDMRAAEDVLRRVDITAPRDGIVVGLAVNTPGGVIAPGADLLSIVPQDETLVVRARLNPTDIDVVHAGLAAEVRLLAFNLRRTPTIRGVVRQVSADLLEDPATGEAYYAAEIRLDPAALAAAGATLYPGMPVEAMIVTGKRTALDYVAQPILASAGRAFRED